MHTWIGNPFSAFLFVAALFSGAIAVYAWLHREFPGGMSLAILLGTSAFWAAAYGIELGCPTLETKIFWSNFSTIAVSVAAPLALILVLQYLGKGSWLKKRVLLPMFAFAGLTVFLYWTNPWHGWIEQNYRLVPVGKIYSLKADPEWYFWLYAGYSYLLLTLSAVLLIWHLRDSEAKRRKGIVLVLLSMFTIWAFNAISLFDLLPLPDIDWTPVSFIMLGTFAAWGIFQERILFPDVDAALLIDPFVPLLLKEDYRRVRILSATSLLSIPFLFGLMLYSLTVRPQAAKSLGAGMLFMVLAYGFSRSRYFKVGIGISLLTFWLLPISIITQLRPGSLAMIQQTFVWVIPTLVFASLLLKPGALLAFSVIAIGATMASSRFVPLFTNVSESPKIPFGALVIVAIWLLVSSWLRHKNFQDIDRYTAEIGRANRFLNDVINSLDNPFYVINVEDYSIEMANKAAQMLGEAKTQTCFAFAHRRDAPCTGLKNPCPVMQVRETKSPYVVEHTHYHPDGSTYYAEVHGYPILDGDGNVVQMIEYSLDITARKQAENELLKLNQAIEQTATPIVITDADGAVEYVNPAFTEITGYTREETIGKNTNLLKSGEHPAAFYKDIWETVRHGGIWQGELVNRRKDGSHYIEEQIITPVTDERGKITNYIAVKQDITARKKAEETIRKLSQAVEQSASTIVITDREGNIEYANSAFSRVTGYTLEEAAGQNPRILKSGKMPPAFYREMWETLTSGKTWSGEMINRKKNGELYWEFATIAPVKDEDGKITHYIAVKDDITARKKMEDELRVARDRALEASRLKSRILANVSHDMRTPLGSILGYADMLRAGVFGPLNDAQREKIQKIIESNNHLREFVDNLLMQSELEAGKLTLQGVPISMPAFWQELDDRFSVLAVQKDITFTVELDSALPETIIGDRYWLDRVISNLVSNAIKFTPQGGRVSLAGHRITEEYWSIEVVDTGVGIPPDEIAGIFEPFQKGSGNRPAVSGAGLGLAIVREVVEQMGGKITVQSTLNQGSTFTILLPLETSQENAL